MQTKSDLTASLVGGGNKTPHIDRIINLIRREIEGPRGHAAEMAFANALVNNKDGFATLLTVVAANLYEPNTEDAERLSVEYQELRLAFSQIDLSKISSEELRAALAPLKGSASVARRPSVAVERVSGRSWWSHFLIGFAGPASLVQSILELKPLTAGDSVRFAWGSTTKRLAKRIERVHHERR